jgi:hypothetical protein
MRSKQTLALVLRATICGQPASCNSTFSSSCLVAYLGIEIKEMESCRLEDDTLHRVIRNDRLRPRIMSHTSQVRCRVPQMMKYPTFSSAFSLYSAAPTVQNLVHLVPQLSLKDLPDLRVSSGHHFLPQQLLHIQRSLALQVHADNLFRWSRPLSPPARDQAQEVWGGDPVSYCVDEDDVF